MSAKSHVTRLSASSPRVPVNRPGRVAVPGAANSTNEGNEVKSPRRLVMSGLAVGLATLAASVVGAAPAQAARSDCPANAFCLWEHDNFNGAWFAPSGGGDSFPHFGTKGFDNISTSGYNNTNNRWCLYEEPDFGGRWLTFDPFTQIDNMGFDFQFNDKASSARRC